ncbi:PEP-CTERM sorting domain-containing protein [Mucisphaera sp.]|uniref:PEP-CTERM sorting domain-containing protein n=1 Tax=Mucisphaera sp. TaxID=2913024 RepID=UPI003D0D5073
MKKTALLLTAFAGLAVSAPAAQAAFSLDISAGVLKNADGSLALTGGSLAIIADLGTPGIANPTSDSWGGSGDDVVLDVLEIGSAFGIDGVVSGLFGPYDAPANTELFFVFFDNDFDTLVSGLAPATSLIDAGPGADVDFGIIDGDFIITNPNANGFPAQALTTEAFGALAPVELWANDGTTAATSGNTGDFNGDTVIDQVDIDLLVSNLGDPGFDLTNDGVSDSDDLEELILNVIGTSFGDANLDGNVDLIDLSALATNFNGTTGWAGGNFNTDSVVDLIDLSVLATNFGASNPIPEPVSAALLGLGGIAILGRRSK